MVKNITALLLLLLLFSCKSSNPNESYVEIEWKTNTLSLNTGSLFDGGIWTTTFRVIEGFGRITFNLYVDNKKEKSKSVTVEEGLQYTIVVSVNTENCSGGAINEVKIKPSSSDNDVIMQALCSPLTVNTMKIYDGYSQL